MSARDELATIREAHWVTDNTNLGQYRTGFKCVCGAEWVHDGHDPEQVPGPELFEQHVADAILAAGYRKPRTITTFDELDELPRGSVVLDRDGLSLHLDYAGWNASNGTRGIERETLEREAFPAIVLHEEAA